ncbi:transient receptor potential cation channel subfamily A member 1 [Neocloeon triangulifer]|uniref:transient receptor potential cation channel subfamily A member 1 n=1 Tax=Neocloeon triangulifer TaxID=2078957 RepID=UPI00286F7271|nr:transient receptor potential cation channel subfamily A member 1 [Neocloeon triangulifer]
MSQHDDRLRGGGRPPLTRSSAVNPNDHPLNNRPNSSHNQIFPKNSESTNNSFYENNQIKWATELHQKKDISGDNAGLSSVWQGLHSLWVNSNPSLPVDSKEENMPIAQRNSWIRRGVRRLLFRQNAQQHDEEALQEMLRVKGNASTNADSKFTGEVCLLQDSPFRIIRAAESGNVEEFSRLFFTDPNRINVRDSKGRTAIHQAAARNQVPILQFILTNHSDLNMIDTSGNTPLHLAVENTALEAVDFLLTNGADASILNLKNQAPIHLATVLNLVTVLESMSRHRDKFDVQQGGEHGRTALHIAAIHDFDECARILITQFGAVPRKPCNNGYYPIHEAAKNASSKTMEVFLQWGEARGCSREEMISFFDSEGNVPLHSAVHGGDIKAVELCLRSGAKISTQQHDLSTPVHLACAQGATEIVRLMFKMQPGEKAQCLSSCDVQKMTPLHCAAMFDHPEIVEFLIEEGADMNVVDKERRSPLLLAASKSGWRTVKTLTHFGANIHIKDSSLRNVLHLIVMNGGKLEEFASLVCRTQSPQQFELLLNERDMSGCSPLHYASREGQIRSLQNLITLGACVSVKNNKNESPLHFAARYGRYNTIKELLDSERSAFIINESDGDGLTPLHIASQQGHTRVVQLLLSRGALLHRDHLGRTPLHLAASNGYTQTMELLHSVHSHLLDQADKDGNTALHLATMENRHNAISLLLSLGCKLLYNNSDLSAIDYAIYFKFPEAALAMVTHSERAAEVMALKSDKHPCVTLALIASMPKVFEAVQDGCITKANCKKDSKSFYIRYCFSCLQCAYVSSNSDQKSREMMSGAKPNPLPALNAMVTHGRVELLAHPLSQKYLQMKWNSYGKYFHLANLLLYTVFLTFVTSFVTKLMSRPFVFAPSQSAADLNFSLPAEQSFGEVEDKDATFVICGICILVYIAINGIREGMQMYQQRLHYLLDPFNIVSWMLYISAVAMVLPIFDPNLEPIQYSCASITAFLAWFNLLLYLQRFDQVGIYVVMFLEILQTLIKVLFVFSILIIAFGLSLYILLSRGNHQAFETVPMSLMRTFAMMLGEIDFLNTYVHSYNQKGDSDRTLPFPAVTFVILGIFMVFMPILLMNLLIGLAVGDIESVRRNAQLKRLAMQVILHSELERKLPRMLLERIDKMEVIEYPNDSKCKGNIIDRIFRQWFFNPFTDELAVKSDGRNDYRLTGAQPDRTMQHFKKSLQSDTPIDDDVLEELDSQKRLMKDVLAKLDSQQYLLRLVLQKMEIKTEADDIDEGVSPRVFKSDGTLVRWTSPRFNKKYRMCSMNRSYE